MVFLTDFDQYVLQICRHNKLVQEIELSKVIAYQQHNPQMSLLEILFKSKLISKEQALHIKERFERQNANHNSKMRTSNSISPSHVSTSYHPQAQTQAQGSLARFKSMEDFLEYARELEVSDLFINVNCPPLVRKWGNLTALDRSPFHAKEIEVLVQNLLSPELLKRLHEHYYVDTCLELSNHHRYRTCILKQKDGINCSFRIISSTIKTAAELQLPDAIKKLVHYNQGLIIIAGPAGSGKTTTIAALIDEINKTRNEHIITIEDPIENVFKSDRCQISQRAVKLHTKSFSAALRGALREDPDIIMIGDLRDYETASLAISASETGHLVITSLHTPTASKTISRLTDFFPPKEQGQIRSMIAESIRGIVCQRLMTKLDGQGQVLAQEIMLNNSAISNIIKKNQLLQLNSTIQTSSSAGMTLMDNSIYKLYQNKMISGEEAYHNSENKLTYKQFSPEEIIRKERKRKG